MRPIDADNSKEDLCRECENEEACKLCQVILAEDKEAVCSLISGMAVEVMTRSVDDIKHRDLVDEDGKELSE